MPMYMPFHGTNDGEGGGVTQRRTDFPTAALTDRLKKTQLQLQ